MRSNLPAVHRYYDLRRRKMRLKDIHHYDTYVPIVFAGMGLEPRIVDRRVQTVDVAVTLSAFMGIKPPSGSAGVPLVEVLAE